MKTSGGSMPPEWLDTTSAPPDDGRLSRLRTSARWYCLISGPMVFATCLVNAGSHWTVSRFAGAPEPLPAILDPSRFPLVLVGQRLRETHYPWDSVRWEHATLIFGECHIRLLRADQNWGRWPRRFLSRAVSV